MDERVADRAAIRGVGLLRGHGNESHARPVRAIDPVVVDEQCVGANAGDGALEVQAAAHRHARRPGIRMARRPPRAVRCPRRSSGRTLRRTDPRPTRNTSPPSSVPGASMRTHVRPPLQRRGDRGDLRATRVGAGARQDRDFVEHDGRVLDEDRVRQVWLGSKLHQAAAERRQRPRNNGRAARSASATSIGERARWVSSQRAMAGLTGRIRACMAADYAPRPVPGL